MVSYVQSFLAHIPRLFTPIWLRPKFTYSRALFSADVSAGITVAIIQVPQSMAFAITAGLPAVYGLYASLFGCIASLWGSSRTLSTGPVAMVSLLTLTSLVSLAPPGSNEFIRLAATLALLTGIIYLGMGLFRFGSMIHLVPHSVIAGFSSAAAVLIIITQIPALLGIPAPRSDIVLKTIINLIEAVPHLTLLTALVGITSVALLYATKRLPKSFPGALVVLTLAIAAGYIFRLDAHHVDIVGAIPAGLPSFVMPYFGVTSFAELLPKAAVIALVAFVATHANAATLARARKEHLNTDQELVGQGLANIFTSFFQGFPISGSFTRSAINAEAGARTGFSSLVASLMTVLTVLFLTPVFYYLPLAALSAIVIVAAISLVDISRLDAMYRISRSDGIVALFTFGMVFVMQPEDALLTGMIVALLLFIRRTVWGAQVTEVGIDLDRRVLLSTIEDDAVHIFPNVVMVRPGVSLYYANTAHVLNQIHGVIAMHEIRCNHAAKHVVFDMSGVNFIDISGMEILEEFIEELERKGLHVSMIYVRPPVFEILKNIAYFEHRSIFQTIAEMRMALHLV
jgi:SulP family sulfate permease